MHSYYIASSCRHRGTPGHKCGSGNMDAAGSAAKRRLSSKSQGGSQIQITTNLTNGNSEITATTAKNGSNGRANSIHMMTGMFN